MDKPAARKPLTRHWTPEETKKLEQLLASGVTPRAAALKLQRRFHAIKAKIRKLGLPQGNRGTSPSPAIDQSGRYRPPRGARRAQPR
jgi:hypothetical protein